MTALPLAVVLTATLLACSLVNAKIHHSVVDLDDRRLIPLTEAFGFSSHGRINITLSNIAVYDLLQKPTSGSKSKGRTEVKKDWSRFGFILSPVEADASLEQSLLEDSFCSLETANRLLRFDDKDVQPILEGKVKSHKFSYNIDEGNLYYLYFANCEPNTPVSFDAVIALYNEVAKGHYDFLSVGDSHLDLVFWVMFALFTGCTIAWGYYIWRNRVHAHKVHYLMLGLIFFKCWTVLSQALMYYYIERTGTADGWNIAYYVFTFFRGVLFFTVVVLIGTGWSYMKPFLGDKERRIIMIVVPLQVFANIAIVITDEESPSSKEWFTWRDVFHLVDIICCCAILFPIVWSIKHLREASQTDGKAARNLEKLTLFRQFYVMVVVYIYFTRIVVYLLRNTMEYQYSWVSEAADQLATLAFYMWTAIKFRPTDTNPYLKLEAGEIEL